MLPEEDRILANPPKTVAVGKGSGIQGAFNDINQYINPPPDYRLNDIVSRKAPSLRHGIIQQTDDVVGDGKQQKYPYACRFLFNPSVINVSYSVADGVTPGGELTVDQLKGMAVYPGQTGIGFSLLFDRTYDVYYGPSAKGGIDLRDVGCYADIAALESVTGVRTSVTANATTTAADGTATSAAITGGLQGNMLMTPCYVIFGGGNGGKTGKPITGLTFVGYITSMTVNYGLFSENMVPTRASVDITMQQLIGRDPLGFNSSGGTLTERGAAKFPTTNKDTRSRVGTGTTRHRRRR